MQLNTYEKYYEKLSNYGLKYTRDIRKMCDAKVIKA